MGLKRVEARHEGRRDRAAKEDRENVMMVAGRTLAGEASTSQPAVRYTRRMDTHWKGDRTRPWKMLLDDDVERVVKMDHVPC